MAAKVVAVFGMSFHPSQGRYLRVHNQLRTLAAAGFDVLLVCWDRECRLPEAETRDGFRILRLRIPAPVGQGPRRNGWNVLRFNLAIHRRLMREPADILHCYNLDAILAVFLVAKRRGLRAVLDLCEPEYYGLWKARYRFLLGPIGAVERALARRCDQVFVHNLFQVRKLRSAGVARLTRVGSYPSRSLVATAPAGSGGGRFVIGRLGTIYEDNGIEEILAAYRLLLEREQGRDGPRYHLYLAGRVFDRYRPTLLRLVEPFRERLTLHGPFDAFEMPKLYAGLDLSLVLARPTRWFRHITPTKLFDSMACGVPVVASPIGEVREIVEEGAWGVTVDERDPKSICEAIETIARTPGLRDDMARRAVRLASDKYTWEVCEPDFLAGYSRVAGAAARFADERGGGAGEAPAPRGRT